MTETIRVGSRQFMEADKTLDLEPSGETMEMYTHAVEKFVKANHGALVEHLARKAAETREQIRLVMYAARRLRAFEPAGEPAQ